MGSEIATEIAHEKIEAKPEREPKPLMSNPPMSPAKEQIPISRPATASNLRMKASIADFPPHLRRNRVNSSKMVVGNGREVYAHSGTNGELKVYRTGPVKGKDELNAFEGTDTTELEMEGLNLEQNIKARRLVKDSHFLDESYGATDYLKIKGQHIQLDLDMGEIAKHGTAQVKTYLFDRTLAARLEGH